MVYCQFLYQIMEFHVSSKWKQRNQIIPFLYDWLSCMITTWPLWSCKITCKSWFFWRLYPVITSAKTLCITKNVTVSKRIWVSSVCKSTDLSWMIVQKDHHIARTTKILSCSTKSFEAGFHTFSLCQVNRLQTVM